MTRTDDSKVTRADAVEAMRILIQSGNAGVNHKLRIVDRREFPEAMSLPYFPYMENKGRKRFKKGC